MTLEYSAHTLCPVASDYYQQAWVHEWVWPARTTTRKVCNWCYTVQITQCVGCDMPETNCCCG